MGDLFIFLFFSMQFRDVVLNAGGLEALESARKSYQDVPDNTDFLRNMAWTISNLLRGRPSPDLSQVCSRVMLIAMCFALTSDLDFEISTPTPPRQYSPGFRGHSCIGEIHTSYRRRGASRHVLGTFISMRWGHG